MLTFTDLPFDLVTDLIVPHLDDRGLCSLSETCRLGRDATKVRRALRALRAQETVLQAVVYGDEAKVMRLLKHNPRHLLSNIGKVVDYSGKAIENLTPFQAALCAGDEIMIEEMAAIFIANTFIVKGEGGIEVVKDGRDIMRDQFEVIYPNGDVDAVVEAQRLSADSCQLIDNVFVAIDRASDVDLQQALEKQFDIVSDLNSALIQFKEDFFELSNREQIYNPYHLLKVFEKYMDNFFLLGGWDSAKNNLAWRQIVGYVQRCIPACLAQDFAHGLYYIAEGGVDRRSVPRSFNFRNCGESFFPLSPTSGLGIDFAVGWRVGASRGPGVGGGWGCFSKIMSNKSAVVANLSITHLRQRRNLVTSA